jgi:hypothetical protein
VTELMEAIAKLLKELEADENGGGLLSRTSLRAASELRLAVHRAERRPGEEAWRALVVDWSNRVEDLEHWLMQIAEEWPAEHVLPESIGIVIEAPNPPLVPGQPVEEVQSDG